MNNAAQLTATNIKNEMKKFIIDNFLFGNENESFNDDDSFLEKGIIDSTGVLELIGVIEEKYNIKMEDDELIPENLDSLNNITSYIVKKTATKN